MTKLVSHWALEPGRVFLNHGSYGACPRVVLEHQAELRAQLERSPVHFMSRQYPKLLSSLRNKVAEFLGARAENLAFVSNATSGVNAVLRSLDWEPGDEIIVTNHGYNACRNVVSHLAKEQGVVAVEVDLPFPELDGTHLLESLLAQATKKTKLVMLDHITSPTALVFPISEIAPKLAERGLRLLVDGAHAPGMLDLNLEALGQLGVTYYTGNFHKWCCSPKGSAFLWVAEKDQAQLHPPVISHGFNAKTSRSRFLEEFDWCGSFDPTAFLSTYVAIRFVGSLYPQGWPQLRRECREQLVQGFQIVAESLSVKTEIASLSTGQICSLRLPDWNAQHTCETLYHEYGIDAMVTPWNDQTLLRLSAAPYNESEDYQKLAKALGELESA